MAITVQMIENKEFTTAPMGYKRQEVDMFLDEICDEMDRLNDEIQSLQLKLSQANQQGMQARGQNAAGRPGVGVPAPRTACRRRSARRRGTRTQETPAHGSRR